MNVSKIMTHLPVCVPAHETLERAMNLMDKYQVRHLPVMDGDALIGVVSDRDLLEATGWSTEKSSASKKVSEFIKEPPVTVSPEDTLVMASLAIVVDGIGCLPVLSDGEVVGIVTEIDVLQAYVNEIAAGNIPESKDLVVGEHMTQNVQTIESGSALEEAMALCRTLGVRHLPVVDEDRYVSIVSDRCLRAAYGRSKPDETAIAELMPRKTVRATRHDRFSGIAKAMVEFKVGALPILDGTRLIGIVSTEDLIEHCMNTLWGEAPVG